MITTTEIEHLAKLARIELVPGEAEKLTAEIDPVLEYVGQIQKVSATEREQGSAEPSTANVRNVMREDVITNAEGQYTDKLLANAPSREGEFVKVKKILG